MFERFTQWSPSQSRSTALSVALHLALLLGLAAMAEVGSEAPEGLIESRVIDTTEPEIDRIELAQPLEKNATTPAEIAAGSFAPEVAALAVADPVAQKPVELPDPELTVADVPLPKAAEFDQTVMVAGTGAEHVGGTEGAVDRIAQEILRRLEEGPVLAVWMFDASGSLLAERERLTKHIVGVYENVLKLDQEQLSAGENLLTQVVGFGQNRKALLDAPTNDVQAIASAIGAVGLDKSGVETTFGTVFEVARRWGKFERNDTRYQTMCIIVTDEVGDDEDKLEPALMACREARMGVYVLGSSAVFGKTIGHVPYDDPITKQHYDRIAIRQGPESMRLEMINLPFWGHNDGDLQYEEMESGFGPYGLSRLAGGSSGIYFITRLGPNRRPFDAARLRVYRPDWLSPPEYEKHVLSSPLRVAVTQAALITQKGVPANSPSLTFNAPAGTEQFKDAMGEGQAAVAKITYAVDQALMPITKVAKLRDRETSKRWQAHYDLIRGRLMAMKLRCYEYNWACAQMKVNPKKFEKGDSNAWQMATDTEIHFSEKAAAAGKEATALLEKVVTEHPETPWAVLARRELRDPLGFKWVETYIRPPARMDPAPNTPRKKQQAMPMAKPPEIPKL